MDIKFAELGIVGNTRINEAIQRIIESGRFINGPYGQEFATLWAKECVTEFCVPVASGSAALISVLKAIKTAVHKFVIVPDVSFAATSFAVVEADLQPLFCRCLPNGLMDQAHCLELLNSYGHHVAAVIPVHLYGQIMRIDEQILYKTAVIEDACQAHGAFKGLQGAAAAFSFYPSKNLGAAGDAGAVVTNIPGLKSAIEGYINYGDYPGDKYVHSILGNNLRMDEIQAAVLVEKLRQNYLEVSQSVRELIAGIYKTAGIPSIATVQPNAWHLYPILVSSPKRFQQEFANNGIEVGIHYPYTLSQLHHQKIGCNNSRVISEHVLTLPIGPHMSRAEANFVVGKLRGFAFYDGNNWRLRHAN
jgi:dTDP-4-amino-4,6-dideoxygalactose transaminase